MTKPHTRRQYRDRLRRSAQRTRVLARSRLARAVTGTMLGGIGIQLTLVVTGVITARALGPTDRGHLALLTLVAAIAWTLGQVGLPYALAYFTARNPPAATELLGEVRRPYVRRLWLTVAATAIALFFLTQGRPDYVRGGSLAVICALPAAFAHQAALAMLQGLREFRSFNVLRLLPTGGFAIWATVLFILDAAHFTELTLAWALSMIIAGPITLTVARRKAASISRGSDGDPLPLIKRILSFGRRSLLGGSPPVETYRLDQSAVALFLAPASLGLYVAALAFTNLPRFFGRSIGLVANPYVASQHSRAAALRMMWRFVGLGIVTVTPVILALWAIAPTLVPFFFGDEFEGSVPVVRILLFAALFYSFRRVLSDGARGAGLPVAGSVAEVVAVGTALGLFAILIPVAGLEGAAYALAGSSFAAFAALVVLVTIETRRGRRAATPAVRLDEADTPEL